MTANQEIIAELRRVLKERDEAIEAFRDATRLRSEIQQARIKAENERDEARAEVQDYREQLRKLPDANRVASQDAYRRGHARGVSAVVQGVGEQRRGHRRCAGGPASGGHAMTTTTDRLTHAIDALAKRIEPRMSRHPVTVVQHAGSVIYRIGEAIDCQFEDGDDLVAAVKELVRERDEALSRMEDLEADVRYYEDRWERIIGGAYIRGAEAMREACAREASVCANHRGEELDAILSALPIPEEP